MKKQILILAMGLTAITVITVACKKKKDDESVNPAAQTCYIKSYKDNDSKDSTLIEYNADNKPSKFSYFDSLKKSNGYDIYSYSVNKITETDYDKTGKLTHTNNYYLNADGTVNYIAYVSANGTTTANYDTIYYTYDNGYNVKQIEVTTNFYNNVQMSKHYDTTWSTFTDGNMVQQKESRQSGMPVTTTYTYTSLEDKNNLFSGDASFIPGLFGKGNKNLIQSSVSDDTNANKADYTYTVDSNGLITRMISAYTGKSNSITFDFGYTYLCK